MTNAIFGLLLVVVGVRVWRLGRQLGYVSPGDIVEDYYGSKLLRFLLAIVLIAFTIPYMQVQIMGAGYIFEASTQGLVPFWLGALITTLTIMIYTSIGGKRAAAWTNIIQGILLTFGIFIGGTVIVALAGGLAAAMSTIDQQAHAISVLTAKDIVEGLRIKISEGAAINLGRAVIILSLITAYVFALQKPEFLAYIGAVATSGTAQFLPLLLGVLFWKRATRAGALAGLIGGTLVTIWMQFLPPPEIKALGIMSGWWGLLVNVILFIAVSLVTKPVSPEKIEKIHELANRKLA